MAVKKILNYIFYYDGRVNFSQAFQMQNFNKGLFEFPKGKLKALGYSGTDTTVFYGLAGADS